MLPKQGLPVEKPDAKSSRMVHRMDSNPPGSYSLSTENRTANTSDELLGLDATRKIVTAADAPAIAAVKERVLSVVSDIAEWRLSLELCLFVLVDETLRCKPPIQRNDGNGLFCNVQLQEG